MLTDGIAVGLHDGDEDGLGDLVGLNDTEGCQVGCAEGDGDG